MIDIERVYEASGKAEGRFLVDRVWPRGLKKEDLPLEGWAKEAAPSTELRKWFGHDPARWSEFKRRYQAELETKPEAWRPILEAARRGKVTLLYAAKDAEHNNAVVLKEYLEKRLNRRTGSRPKKS